MLAGSSAMLAMLVQTPVTPAPRPPLVTERSLDALVACLRETWADEGAVTAINTAAGVMLDIAPADAARAPATAAPGPSPAPAAPATPAPHGGVTIDDRGTERSIVATPGSDPAFSARLIERGAHRCLSRAEPAAR